MSINGRGILLGSSFSAVIIVTDTTGNTVTATNENGKLYSEIVDENGKANIKVRFPGTYTVTNETASETVVVCENNKTYPIGLLPIVNNLIYSGMSDEQIVETENKDMRNALSELGVN